MRGIIQRANRALAGAHGLLAWAAGLGVCLGFCARPGSTPVFVDEIYWIGSAYYFHLAADARDFGNPDWRLLPARENPPVAKYLIGAALAVAGEKVNTPDTLGSFYLVFSGVPGAWGAATDQAKRNAVVSRMTPAGRDAIAREGRINLPPTWLRPARIAMVVSVAMASLLLFLLGRVLVGAMPALLVSIGLPLHPVASEALNHALADAPALMFSIGAMALLVACLRAAGRGPAHRLRAGALAVAAGGAAGLACATKMNSLVVPAVAAAGFSFLLLARVRAGDGGGFRALAFSAGLFAAASLLAFLAVNPALYGDWWEGVRSTVEEHRNTARIQAGFIPGSLNEIPERMGALGRLIGFSSWSWPPLIACALLLLLKPRSAGHRLVAAWWLAAWLMVGAWIPFPWQRYAAPLLAPSLLLLAALTDWIASAPARGAKMPRPVQP